MKLCQQSEVILDFIKLRILIVGEANLKKSKRSLYMVIAAMKLKDAYSLEEKL